MAPQAELLAASFFLVRGRFTWNPLRGIHDLN